MGGGTDPQKAGLKEVGLSWELILVNVSDADEQFTLELDLKYTWIARGFKDAWEAAGKPNPKGAECKKLIEKCWDPRLRIANVAGEEEKVSTVTLCVDFKTGRMHRFAKHRVTCSESLELHRFPFDRQLLAIHVSTFRDTDEVIFVPYDKRPSRNSSRAGRWKVYNERQPLLIIPHHTSKGLIATSNRAYHRVFIAIEAERDANWYITHFIIPHCVIIAMNANVTLIPRNDVADRNAVTLTLLLTAVGMRLFASSPSLPALLPRSPSLCIPVYLMRFTRCGHAAAPCSRASPPSPTHAHLPSCARPRRPFPACTQPSSSCSCQRCPRRGTRRSSTG
jgi:hypothetical protein